MFDKLFALLVVYVYQQRINHPLLIHLHYFENRNDFSNFFPLFKILLACHMDLTELSTLVKFSFLH